MGESDNYRIALQLLQVVAVYPYSGHIHEAISCFLGEEIPECECGLCLRIATASRRAQERYKHAAPSSATEATMGDGPICGVCMLPIDDGDCGCAVDEKLDRATGVAALRAQLARAQESHRSLIDRIRRLLNEQRWSEALQLIDSPSDGGDNG